jgi:hypothetical protein
MEEEEGVATCDRFDMIRYESVHKILSSAIRNNINFNIIILRILDRHPAFQPKSRWPRRAAGRPPFPRTYRWMDEASGSAAAAAPDALSSLLQVGIATESLN